MNFLFGVNVEAVVVFEAFSDIDTALLIGNWTFRIRFNYFTGVSIFMCDPNSWSSVILIYVFEMFLVRGWDNIRR